MEGKNNGDHSYVFIYLLVFLGFSYKKIVHNIWLFLCVIFLHYISVVVLRIISMICFYFIMFLHYASIVFSLNVLYLHLTSVEALFLHFDYVYALCVMHPALIVLLLHFVYVCCGSFACIKIIISFVINAGECGKK